ncbi:NAD-dependent epimerase/dehydratase family protein [Pseudonocardia sp. GCM10023141]|uniref:NAD-dependent epimerase/dehydratase family protein n=1 Tax=Pseudonocardia sp. GCM10023141 TaxID=3252653 RepID=UPI00361FA04F
MTHVLVAGATGVVGSRVLPLLLAAGHTVSALLRSPAAVDGLRAAGVRPLVADVFDRDAVKAAVTAARPDVVMHQLTSLAGGDLAANAAIRREGTRNLVDAALAADVCRVVAQSIAWAYAAGEAPAREDEPLDVAAAEPRQTSVLGVAALEDAVREVPEAVLLRYGLLYGPGSWYTAGGARAADAVAGRIVADDAVSSLLHVDDAAAAAVAALDWPAGTVNVCDDEPAPARDWVPAFSRSVGAPPPPQASGRAGWARGADNHHARFDLGWAPRYPSWRAGFGAAGG